MVINPMGKDKILKNVKHKISALNLVIESCVGLPLSHTHIVNDNMLRRGKK
jgi:hypothetical protein